MSLECGRLWRGAGTGGGCGPFVCGCGGGAACKLAEDPEGVAGGLRGPATAACVGCGGLWLRITGGGWLAVSNASTRALTEAMDLENDSCCAHVSVSIRTRSAYVAAFIAFSWAMRACNKLFVPASSESDSEPATGSDMESEPGAMDDLGTGVGRRLLGLVVATSSRALLREEVGTFNTVSSSSSELDIASVTCMTGVFLGRPGRLTAAIDGRRADTVEVRTGTRVLVVAVALGRAAVLV